MPLSNETSLVCDHEARYMVMPKSILYIVGRPSHRLQNILMSLNLNVRVSYIVKCSCPSKAPMGSSKPALLPSSIPTVVPNRHRDDRQANKGEHNAEGDFDTLGEAARVAGECGVAGLAAGLLGGVRAGLQASEERVRGIVQNVHRGKREHWRVVV